MILVCSYGNLKQSHEFKQQSIVLAVFRKLETYGFTKEETTQSHDTGMSIFMFMLMVETEPQVVLAFHCFSRI